MKIIIGWDFSGIFNLGYITLMGFIIVIMGIWNYKYIINNQRQTYPYTTYKSIAPSFNIFRIVTHDSQRIAAEWLAG